MSRRTRKSVEGVVRDMAHDGSAVVQTASGVVLSAGGQTGERVRVRLTEKRKGTQRGQLLEVLDAASSRVSAFCAELERCGGCAWGEMSVDAQRAHKRRWVAEAVGLAPELVAVRSGASERYRRRARWAWSERRGACRIGYHPARSRDVVAVSQCPVLRPALQGTLTSLREALGPHLRGTGEIEVLASEPLPSGEQVGVFIRSRDPQPAGFYAACEALSQGALIGVVAQIEEVAPAVFGAKHVPLVVKAGGRSLDVQTPIGGFAQGNAELNDVLIECVMQSCPAEPQTVVDLFSGSGNLSLALATLGPQKMWMVESDRAALDACRQNWKSLEAAVSQRVVAKFVDAAVQDVVAKLPSKADVFVLDPPREGAGMSLMRALSGLRPEHIVYVSCNPATLGRDIGALEGYRVQSATMVDMFPQTPHVESVTLLLRE